MSGILQGTATTLARQINSDRVNRELGRRSSIEDMIAAGIVNSDPKVAPALQAAQRRLSQTMTGNVLAHLLESRPDPQELQDSGVLRGTGSLSANVSDRLRECALALDRNIRRDSVLHLLDTRPPPDELMRLGILRPGRCV